MALLKISTTDCRNYYAKDSSLPERIITFINDAAVAALSGTVRHVDNP